MHLTALHIHLLRISHRLLRKHVQADMLCAAGRACQCDVDTLRAAAGNA